MCCESVIDCSSEQTCYDIEHMIVVESSERCSPRACICVSFPDGPDELDVVYCEDHIEFSFIEQCKLADNTASV